MIAHGCVRKMKSFNKFAQLFKAFFDNKMQTVEYYENLWFCYLRSTTNRPKVEENVPDPHLAKPLEYEYNMDHKSRGMAIIFNHERFDQPGVPTRYGTNIDRDNLRETFKSLGFTVKVFNDRTYSEIKDDLEDSKSEMNE